VAPTQRTISTKAKWAELLDEVERGRTVRITRHGKAIARIVPEGEGRSAEAVEALERRRRLDIPERLP
jgi:prevent-host-death family protein